MNVVSMVANLQKESDWYKEQYKECQEIINQLVNGPGEFEYIHPLDLADKFCSFNDHSDFIEAWVDSSHAVDSSGAIVMTEGSKKYKQSTNIPAKTKRFK